MSIEAKKVYALHGGTFLHEGQKFYVNPKDLVELYNLTDEDKFVFWDARKHRGTEDNYVHLKVQPEHLEKLFPDYLGEYALHGGN